MSEVKHHWTVSARWRGAASMHEPIGFVVPMPSETHARALADCLTFSLKELDIEIIHTTTESISEQSQ